MVNTAKTLLIMLKNLAQKHLKLLQKKFIQKTAEATGDLIGNQLGNKIIKISRSSPQNNWETITKEHDEEIPEEGYIPPVEKQKSIDDLRFI